jgi:hypothetical protein
MKMNRIPDGTNSTKVLYAVGIALMLLWNTGCQKDGCCKPDCGNHGCNHDGQNPNNGQNNSSAPASSNTGFKT